MEKKTIEVIVLKTIPPGQTPSGPQAKASLTGTSEEEVGGRVGYWTTAECPNGHLFRAVADTDYWVTVECPVDHLLFQI